MKIQVGITDPRIYHHSFYLLLKLLGRKNLKHWKGPKPSFLPPPCIYILIIKFMLVNLCGLKIYLLAFNDVTQLTFSVIQCSLKEKKVPFSLPHQGPQTNIKNTYLGEHSNLTEKFRNLFAV